MNERQAKKKRKKEEELKNAILIKEISESTKEDIKKKEELLKTIETNRINLEKLQKAYNDNLDKDLMPIDVAEFKKIADEISELDAKQRELKMKVKELEKEISEKIIKISESEEPTAELPVKDINEELNKEDENKRLEIYDENEQPTQELSVDQIERAVRNSQYESDVKIEFDLKNSLYRIYSPYSEAPIIHVVSKNLLDPSSDEYRTYISELRQKYGSLLNVDGLDLNIVKAFEEFDAKFDAGLANKYVKNAFGGKIIYDLRKFNHSNKSIVNNDFLNSKERKQLKNIAKNYNKNHDNCAIVTFNKKAAATLGIGTAIVAAATGVGVYNKVQDKKIEDSVAIESTIEEDLDKTEELSEKTPTTEIEENKKKEELVDGMPVEEDEKDIIYYDLDGQRTLKVGDIISAEDMGNVGVYGSSDAVSITEPANYTDRYFFDGYMIDAISLLDGNTILEVARNNTLSIQELIEKYEKEALDLRASFHVKGLDKNNNVINPDVGWIDYYEYEDEYKNKNTMGK